MPPQHIIMGMPWLIMASMRLQQSMNISFEAPSIGIISQVMPEAVILHSILHIIIGMGIIWGIMFGIICGIMPPIMFGIMPGIICGIMFMPPIIWGIIPPIMFGIMPGIICGIMFIIGIPIMGIFVAAAFIL